MQKRWFLPFLLALSLLFSQHGALLHALSHLSETASSESQRDKHQPHSHGCEKCTAYAQLDSGPASSPLAPVSGLALLSFVVLFLRQQASELPAAYLSRAPPFFV